MKIPAQSPTGRRLIHNPGEDPAASRSGGLDKLDPLGAGYFFAPCAATAAAPAAAASGSRYWPGPVGTKFSSSS